MDDLGDIFGEAEAGDIFGDADAGDIVGGAVADTVVAAAELVGWGLFWFLPDYLVRYLLVGLGVLLGMYLLVGDGVIDGSSRDLAGLGFMLGSPFFLILVPRWWHNI
ncbi:MAG TPA: hypothetical protein VF552_05760 [Allosphingosinicella sp.]